MSNRIVSWAAITVAAAATPLVAHADPVLCEATGNYYEVIAADGIEWTAARDAASTLVHEGVNGHLATVASAAEDACIDQLRASEFDTNGPAQAWLGGFQADGGTEPGGGWEWLNGEGSIPGTDSADPYADWANTMGNSEPNDLIGDEQHLSSGRFGLGLGWNDEGTAPDTIRGYIVEFEVVAAAQNCLEGEDGIGGAFGCNITGAQNLELPNESLEKLKAGDTVTQFYRRPDPAMVAANVNPDVAAACTGEFAFPDPRVDVNGRPVGSLRYLDVFEELGGGLPGEVILDAVTYGSPCFAIIEGGANFELVDVLPDGKGGVATLTQIPEAVPGIGPTRQCYDPAEYADLQQATQFAYQTSDRLDMVERTSAVMTNNCNSPSRAATFKFSFYTLNTHEDCGIDYGHRFGPVKVQLCFKLLALAKHNALEQSLRNARLTLAQPVYNQMTRTLNRAEFKLIVGRYTNAYADYLEFLAMVEDASWDIDASNHPGNLIMRAQNLLFRAETLQQAQDNLF